MSTYPVNNILFLDIETVPQYSDYSLLPQDHRTLWELKASYIIRNKESETTETVYPRAGIYAEFGKIICIGCGIMSGNGTEKKLSVKCFCGDDEKLVLHQFSEMLNKWSANTRSQSPEIQNPCQIRSLPWRALATSWE